MTKRKRHSAEFKAKVALEAIRDPTLADAILDRLVHNAHRLKLTGDSM